MITEKNKNDTTSITDVFVVNYEKFSDVKCERLS